MPLSAIVVSLMTSVSPLDPPKMIPTLDWSETDTQGRARRDFVGALLAIRAREIVPRLRGATFDEAVAEDDGYLAARWRLGSGASLHLEANLSDTGQASITDAPGRLIWGNPGELGPWQVRWSIGDA